MLSENINEFSVSIVVPVYACAGCLEELCLRLSNTLRSITNRFEIILVDDRSPDNAWNVITNMQGCFPQVKGVRLSRNFGQHIAISAGLAESRGDYIIVMDGDLQDPPEKIPELITKMQEGYDLVFARRIERNHSFIRLLSSKIYFKLLSYLTGTFVDGSYGTFSILSRKVVNAFLSFGEKERHYSFILKWLGFKNSYIQYEHLKRTVGKSAYSIKRLLSHAIDGLFFQATVLLHCIVAIGLLFSLCGFGLALYYVCQYFAYGSIPGWTSMVFLILICTGVLLVSLGVIGLYIGKIFDQTKGRPLYVLDLIIDRSVKW